MSNNLTDNLNESLGDKLDRLIAAVASLDTRLTDLGTKVDQRLHDTRPIWEGVQTQLAEISQAVQQHSEILQQHSEILQQHSEILQQHSEILQQHREILQQLRADTEKGFRTIDRRMERQIGEFERLHAYQRDLEDRVDRIEKISNP